METYITVCKIGSQQKFALWLRKLKQELCIILDDWDGEGHERDFTKGGDMCILMADPRCYMAETNISLLSNYPPIKKTNENNLGSISE